MFKVQRFIFNGQNDLSSISHLDINETLILWTVLFIIWDIIKVFSFALSMWYRGASVTLCARKIRNSWCSCPCLFETLQDHTKNMGPDTAYSQNTHAPPGKATPQYKPRERSSANTDWSDQSHSFQTSVNKCRKVSERGVGVGEINWFLLNLFPDWHNFSSTQDTPFNIYWISIHAVSTMWMYIIMLFPSRACVSCDWIVAMTDFSQVTVACSHICCFFLFFSSSSLFPVTDLLLGGLKT